MQKLCVLVVDDASYIRDLVKRTIRQHLPDCILDEAVNGRKANSMINKKRYDLILCDWEMPEMSGIELLKLIRKNEKSQQLKKTPFVMVTSRGDKKNVIEAVQAGVSDYIGKPFTAEQLVSKVNKALRHKLNTQQAKANGQYNYNHANPLLKAKLNQLQQQLHPNQAELQATPEFLGDVQIRSAHQQCKAQIKDINLTHILLEVNINVMKPAILESIVIDIELTNKGDNIARINAFVCLLQAKSNHNSDDIFVKLQYVDEDAQKMLQLSNYVAKLRKKKH